MRNAVALLAVSAVFCFAGSATAMVDIDPSYPGYGDPIDPLPVEEFLPLLEYPYPLPDPVEGAPHNPIRVRTPPYALPEHHVALRFDSPTPDFSQPYVENGFVITGDASVEAIEEGRNALRMIGVGLDYPAIHIERQDGGAFSLLGFDLLNAYLPNAKYRVTASNGSTILLGENISLLTWTEPHMIVASTLTATFGENSGDWTGLTFLEISFVPRFNEPDPSNPDPPFPPGHAFHEYIHLDNMVLATPEPATLSLLLAPLMLLRRR